MSLFRSVRALPGTLTAFGWFLLTDIPFWCVIPLFPLGLLIRKAKILYAEKTWIDGAFALFSVLFSCYALSLGAFEGHGVWCLLFLALSVAFFFCRVPAKELNRVAGWWSFVFILIFAALLVATAVGVRSFSFQSVSCNWIHVVVFYFFAVLDPMSAGPEFLEAPLLLSLMLIPFGAVSFFALGGRAFSMLEFPYLSVWAGVSIYSFRHFEGIILCFFYGLSIFRMQIFLKNIAKKNCNRKKSIV